MSDFYDDQQRDQLETKKRSKRKKYRETHCFECGAILNSNEHEECLVCGWLECDCTACGCDYEGY